MRMSRTEHADRAEALLLSCRVPNSDDLDEFDRVVEVYPADAEESGIHLVPLIAALTHAVLALVPGEVAS